MRLAVVGVGVAGSYLLARLGEEYRIIGFDRYEESRYYPVCAWGTSLSKMREIAKSVGLNFDDYVLHVGREMLVDLNGEEYRIKLKGLCTFDKLKFERDLIKDREVRFGVTLRSPPPGDYDLVIDSTGLSRALLPKIEKQYLIPTLEYKVKYSDPPFDDFYIKPMPGLSGYLWFFPLGNGYAYVGAGDYYRRHVKALNEFMREHGGEILMKIGRSVRITPPQLCRPFYNGNVVGVGEAIGTVYPMLGEGIIPSIRSAEILIENLGNLKKYEERILKEFSTYYTVFKFIKKSINKKFKWIKDWHLLLRIYLHMRFHEDRYGIEARLKSFLKIVREMKR